MTTQLVQARMDWEAQIQALDDRFICFYTGAADARNSRPRRVDIADTSELGRAYTRGYDVTPARRP
jgi:hypothetical protein